ncbi:Aerobic cobaltochelatase CobS subunit [Polaromonas sp. CG9_12]|nr:Aerobic cobaltochelatase CobS subunit [Polaromonas sp. CG9_12]
MQARVPHFANSAGQKLIEAMVAVADLTRKGFAAGDLSTLMSPRTVITWAENAEIFRDPAVAFSPVLPETSATRPSAPSWPSTSSAALTGNWTNPTRLALVLARLHRDAAPADVQATARQQQRVEELCAAAIRAVSGKADLHFRGRRLYRGHQALPLFAPHLSPSLATDDFGSFRGAADGMALRLVHSDADLHRSLSPVEPLARMLSSCWSSCAAKALAPPDMPGLVRNLRHRMNSGQWPFTTAA